MDAKKEYIYQGPVMLFDNCVERSWKAQTWAVSEQKARNNLTFRYKQDHNLAAQAKISLPGRVISVV